MTISSSASAVTYQGNGATTSFPFAFPVADATDLVVTVTDNTVSPAVVTTLTSGQYSASGIGNPAGGAITYPLAGGALASGHALTIRRVVAYVQNTSIVNQGGFYPDVLEGALDFLTEQAQQLAEGLSRAVQVPLASGLDPADYLSTIQNATNTATAEAGAASTSAADAAVSAASASASAASATTSANNAAANAGNSSASAGSANTSATNAAASATSASSSATTATTQADAAATAAAAAAASAATATSQASTAATSATNAATSASSASTSEAAAGTSAGAASTSAANAATSAAAAAASATSVNLRTINAQSGNYTVVAGDRNKLVEYTGGGGHTFAFTTAATLGSGFEFHVKHAGAGILTLDPFGAETVDGVATKTLAPGQAVVAVCDGANFLITQARGYGAGAGDMLAANNLNDVANAATSWTNLGGGTAGKLTAGTGTGQVPTADQIPGLVGPMFDTPCRQDVLQNFLLDALNGGWAAGGFVASNGGYDAFNSDSLSGVSGTTSQTYDGANKLYGNPSGGGVVQESAAAGTTLGGAYSIVADHIATANNNYTITKIGASCATSCTLTVLILQLVSGTTYNVVYSESFSHPGGSAYADKTLTTPYVVTASGTYRVGLYQPGGNVLQASSAQNSHYYSGVASGSGVNFSGASYDPCIRYTQSLVAANMTLVGAALSPAPASAPSKALLVALWKDLSGSATLNTDFTAEITENGGTNWVAATLADSGLSIAGFKVLTATVTLSSGGTTVQYRLKTFNNKSQQVKGIALMTQ